MNPRSLHTIRDITWYTPETFKFRLERKGFTFKAGQNINIGIPRGGMNREYTIYSGEKDDFIDVLIRRVPDGSLTPRLALLKVGDQVEMHGPYSRFTLPEPVPAGTRFVFIANGTGVAPFHSMVSTFPGLDYQLIHGVRFRGDAYDAAFYGPRYQGCFTRDEGGAYRGRVTGYLKDRPQDKGAHFYICGNRDMINEAYEILRGQGIGGDQIHTETFF